MKKDYGIEAEWKAFELRPGTPPEGMPRPKRDGDTGELSESVKSLSDEIGLKMIRPPFIACSRPALEAAEYAREKGKFDCFHLAVFKAYWEEGKNIGLRTVLREIAEECRLDANDMERLLDEGHYSRVIETQNREAAEIGIRGIPAYIIGQYVITGAQHYGVFQEAMRLLREQDNT